MLVEAIMRTDFATVERDHTALRVARLMKERNLGAVIVVDEKRRPIGVLTDRDLVVRVFAESLAPDTPVDEIMTHPVHAVSRDALVFDALREMARRHVRRLPVIDAETKAIIGLANADEALLILTTEMANIAEVAANPRPNAAAT